MARIQPASTTTLQSKGKKLRTWFNPSNSKIALFSMLGIPPHKDQYVLPVE